MPESGSQILSYQPSVAQGQGANSDIPVIDPKANLDVINNASRDILLLNHDNNIKLYDQKIKDRDNTLNMLAQGQISAGDITPEDRVVYDRAKSNTSAAFFDMINNGGLNNPTAVRNYRDKVAAQNDVAIHAQSRKLELDKLKQEQAGQTLPDDIKSYQTHIDKQLDRPFWNPIDPYQKAFDLNLPSMTSSIMGTPTTEGQIGQLDAQGLPTAQTQWNTTTTKNGVVTDKKTVKTAPVRSAQLTRLPKGVSVGGTQVNKDGTISAISYTPEKYWDLPTMLKNAQEQYISDPTQRENQNQWFDKVNNYPDPQKVKLLQAYNARLADYSKERGIQPDKNNPDGTPHYPDQINYLTDPTGKIQISETPSSFAAKHTLASIDGNYVQVPQAQFNKDIANYNVSKERANSDAFYKQAMAGAANTKARAYAANLGQQMKLRAKGAEQDNFLDEVYTRNILQQPLVQGAGTNNVNFHQINAESSLPVFTLDGKTPKQLIPIGATPVYDKYEANGKPATGAKVQYYKGGHFNTAYLVNGKQLSQQDIANGYTNFAKILGDKWDGSLEDYLKLQIQKNNFDVRLEGANGATDRKLSIAAQRLISNQGTKKGQTAVFDNNQPPIDETGVPEDNNTQQ